jgi:hypothetical protein
MKFTHDPTDDKIYVPICDNKNGGQATHVQMQAAYSKARAKVVLYLYPVKVDGPMVTIEIMKQGAVELEPCARLNRKLVSNLNASVRVDMDKEEGRAWEAFRAFCATHALSPYNPPEGVPRHTIASEPGM